MQEELKLIVELFSKVTDGAVYGGISFLIYKLIVDCIPWAVLDWLSGKLVDRLPRIKKKEKS